MRRLVIVPNPRFSVPAVLVAVAGWLVVPGAAFAQQPAPAPSIQPRYLVQIEAELRAMHLSPQCAAASAQAGTCTLRTSAAAASGLPQTSDARGWILSIQYDDNSDTIYLSIDHYGVIRSDNAGLAATTRRLLEANWEMLTAHFEWSSATGELRLSSVINTDSNFDRRAFRGVVRSLLRLADRYADEVARLTRQPVGVVPPTTP